MINRNPPYRVAYITPVPVEGGAEINLLRLIKALDPKRVVPAAVLVHSGGTLVSRYRSEGLKVSQFKFYEWDWKSPWRIGQTYAQLAFPLLSSKPDLIQINLQYGLDYTARVSQLLRIPFIVHVRGVESKGWKSEDIHLMELAERVVASSEAVLSSLLGSGFQGDEIKVIYEGLDPQAFDPEGANGNGKIEDNSELKYVGIVGRVVPEKGIADFIHAAYIINQSLPQTRFLIVGFGPDEFIDQMEGLTRSMGIEDKIEFTGFLQDVVKILHQLDVLVLATSDPEGGWEEACPNIILEGMATRTPLVASRSGGAVELLADNRGLLFDSGDREALAECISTILSMNQVQRDEMTEKAYVAVSTRFSLQEQVNRFAALYDEILGE